MDVTFFTKLHVTTAVISMLLILKINKKIMVQHFQDVSQKATQNHILDSFAAHLAKTFTQKPSPKNVVRSCLLEYFVR